MNAFNVCVAIIVILTLAGFVAGLVQAKSHEERVPVVAAFTAQVVVVALFLVLVAGMHKSGAVPVVLALACAVLPIAVYSIVQRCCAKKKAEAGADAQASGDDVARDARSKDDVWNNLRGPAQAPQPVQADKAGQADRGSRPAPTTQPAQPLRPVPVAQPVRASQPAETPQPAQSAQPERSAQPTQPVKSVQPVQSQSGAASAAQESAQSATPQTGKEVTQRFAPVATASGVAEKPVQVKGDADSTQALRRAGQSGTAAQASQANAADAAGLVPSENQTVLPKQAKPATQPGHADEAEKTAVLEPVRPQGAAQAERAGRAPADREQASQAQASQTPAGRTQTGAQPVQAQQASQPEQAQTGQTPSQEQGAQDRQANRAQAAAATQQPVRTQETSQPERASKAAVKAAALADSPVADPAEPGIDEKEVARRKAAQEATRKAAIAYADRKEKAEAFRSKGKYLIAAGLFEKAAETAPNKASRRVVAFEQLSCYVKAGKDDKARELARALRRESTLTRAERVKLNAIIAQG